MSGKIIHIDFGDCFEVAMTREKFPEKIPFRLTRMLINAMEVGQPTGSFPSDWKWKICCSKIKSPATWDQTAFDGMKARRPLMPSCVLCRWLEWMETTRKLAWRWWRLSETTETVWWPCWKHLCTIRFWTGGSLTKVMATSFYFPEFWRCAGNSKETNLLFLEEIVNRIYNGFVCSGTTAHKRSKSRHNSFSESQEQGGKDSHFSRVLYSGH